MSKNYLSQKTSADFRRINVHEQDLIMKGFEQIESVRMEQHNGELYWIMEDTIHGDVLVGYTEDGNTFTRP